MKTAPFALLMFCACGHADDKSGTGSAAVAPKTATEKAVVAVTPSTAAAADKTAKKVLSVDALGVEVDAPGCAEVTAIDKDNQSITPNNNTCSVPFPGVVISRGGNMSALPALDDQMKAIKATVTTAEITTHEKTAAGWHLAFKSPATADSPAQQSLQVYAKIGSTDFSCIASGAYDDAKLAVLTDICTSLRAKH
jgi:hypothetical protein